MAEQLFKTPMSPCIKSCKIIYSVSYFPFRNPGQLIIVVISSNMSSNAQDAALVIISNSVHHVEVFFKHFKI